MEKVEKNNENTTAKKKKHFGNFKQNYPTFHRQALLGICGLIGGISSGMAAGFTASLLPQIRDQTYGKGSLIVDIKLLATPIGSSLSGLILQEFGRKLSLIYSTIPSIVGYIILSFSNSLEMFLIGSALVGFASGFGTNAVIVYLAEISEPRLRGLLLSVNDGIGFSSGVLLSHLFGIEFSWPTAMRLLAFTSVVNCVFVCFIPESPYWLIEQDRCEEASKIFFWVRGQTQRSHDEFDPMLSRKKTNVEGNNVKKRKNLLQNICSKTFFVPFFVVAIILTSLVGSGIDLIAFYAIDLLSNMADDLDENKSLLIIDSIRVMAGFLSCIFVKISSRRMMYFWSSIATVLSLVTLAAVLRYQLSNEILVFCLCAYTAVVCLGLIPVSWPMIAEMFPQAIRDVGSGLAIFYLYFLNFVIFEMSTVVIKYWSVSILYGVFALTVFFCSIILYFVLPETDKRTLQQVEDEITNSNRKSKNDV